jgi:hypothetical protein
MTDILIRNIDPVTLQAIEGMAAAHHFKIEKQMSGQEKRASMRGELDALAAFTPKNIRQTPSLELLREDRAR